MSGAAFTSQSNREKIVRVQSWAFWKLAGAIAVAALLATVIASCGSSGALVRRSSILTSDADNTTAHLLLVSSSSGADGGFNFDGYGDGAMRISIPVGWKVDVTCKNASATLSHSCAVVEDLPLSPDGAPLAFPGSATPAPKGGDQPGVSKSFGFVAARVGTYRIACLVSGHEIDGMWDWLSVTRSGAPKVTIRR